MKSLTNAILKKSKRGEIHKSRKETILASLAFCIVFLFLTGMMSFFSFVVTKRLVKINQTYSFVNILLLINFFILFAKSIFESLNVLYFSKDLKVFLRMPIKSKDILQAKFLNMVISEYQMEIIMLAIPMIVYGIITNVTWIFYLYMGIILIFLPITPIMLTSLVIAVIMRFTNFIKNKTKVMYITIILSIFLMGIVMSFFNNQNIMTVGAFTNIILKANGLSESIAEYFILIKPIMNTLLNYASFEGFRNLLIYIVENIICYVIVLFIISKIYLKGAIGTTINSTKRQVEKQEKLNINDFKKNRKYKAYLKKEIITMLRTPIFFIECMLMPLSYPIAIFLIILGIVKFAELVGLNLWQDLYEVSVTTRGLAIFLGVGQVFYMMNFSSIIGISRESNNAIISKFIPISLTKQFNLKISIGLVFNTLATILTTLFYYMCTKNWVFSIIIFIELILINLIGEKFKLLVDLNKPKLDWDSEYTMMKQNTNIMYELFYTLVVGVILFIISKIFTLQTVFLGICFGILVVINILINKYIENKQYEIFGKIY